MRSDRSKGKRARLLRKIYNILRVACAHGVLELQMVDT